MTNSMTPEPEHSSPCSQQRGTASYPEPTESTPHALQSKSLIMYILNPISYLLVGFPSGLLPSSFPTKTFEHFPPLPCVPHASPQLRPSLDLPNNVWGRVQIMKALPHCAAFSSLLLRQPSGPNILLRNQFSNTLSLCEISSSHGGEYDVQSCLLGCTAV
jgi:hypothetical protein